MSRLPEPTLSALAPRVGQVTKTVGLTASTGTR
jgi:hypothetical protein